jgi:peptidoglycan/LPS O-acetylase OafA/YrhL
MTQALSTYLDLIRIVATLLVFIGHSESWTDLHLPLAYEDHDGMVALFVLSGFVIAYTQAEREKTVKLFMTRRLARLYSIMIPAVVLTVLLDFVGPRINPGAYSPFPIPLDHPLGRAAISLAFLNEMWFFSIDLGSNSPMWSISYEVFYYVIFGCFVFLEGNIRYAATFLAAVIAGPKVLLLLPIWLAGAYLYHGPWRFSLPVGAGYALFLASIGVFALLGGHVHTMEAPEEYFPAFSHSRWYLMDYQSAIAICLNFLGASIILRRNIALPKFFVDLARILAARTASIYLFHVPLLFFLSALIPQDGTSVIRIIGLMAATLAVSIGLGYYIERWRRTFEQLVVAPSVGRVDRFFRGLRASERQS